MSGQTHSPETANNDIVATFNEAFEGVEPLHRCLRDEDYDGDGWMTPRGTVVLLGPDCTKVGDVSVDMFEETEYVETTTLEHESQSGETVKNRVYGFTADGKNTQYVRVEYVRTLANDVFDVDYGTIRSWGQTTTDESCIHDGDAPVLFSSPESAYRVLVLPVITGSSDE